MIHGVHGRDVDAGPADRAVDHKVAPPESPSSTPASWMSIVHRVEVVVPPTSEQIVVVVSADERVVPLPADQLVVPPTSGQLVVAASADEHVVPELPAQLVVVSVALENVVRRRCPRRPTGRCRARRSFHRRQHRSGTR